MFEPDQYQLVDFGAGRKLERFGSYLLDRPHPGAEGTARADPSVWKSAHARYRRLEGGRGWWSPAAALPETWTVVHSQTTLQLKATPFGHVGLFPEQAANWDWLSQRVGRAGRSLKVLHLFAYTGAGTLAAAGAGAQVVHVDAAHNIVAWARRNAELSHLSEAPIRWIVDDARRFVQRGLRRGDRYDAVILDPPTYGHGPGGEPWRISRDFRPLLQACVELTREATQFILLTCHSPDWGPAELGTVLAEALCDSRGPRPAAGRMTLRSADGRELPSGAVAFWPPEEPRQGSALKSEIRISRSETNSKHE